MEHTEVGPELRGGAVPYGQTHAGAARRLERTTPRAGVAGRDTAGAAVLANRRSAGEHGGMHRKPLPAEYFDEHGTNIEMRWDSVDPKAELTPQSRLFIRNHSTTPEIDVRDYRLSIFGDGLAEPRDGRDEAVRLRLDELQAMGSVTVRSLLECTGNGRIFFEWQQGQRQTETPWKMGSAGALDLTGVRLAEVLERIGLDPAAREVMATGLDGSYVVDGRDYGTPRRPLPIEKALDDAMLVWAINGEELLPDHGYPLRLFVPGWVGIASIKWLGSLEVSTDRLTSPWNTIWYRMSGGDYPADTEPLTTLPVRSALELPWDEEVRPEKTPEGRRLLLTGRSWSGEGPIARVEVSVDRGASWSDADLAPEETRQAWTQWSWAWAEPPCGRQQIWVRGTDVHGRTQPLETPLNAYGYCFDAVVRHPITIVD